MEGRSPAVTSSPPAEDKGGLAAYTSTLVLRRYLRNTTPPPRKREVNNYNLYFQLLPVHILSLLRKIMPEIGLNEKKMKTLDHIS